MKAYFFIPLVGFLTSWTLSYVMKWLGHRYAIFDNTSWRKIHTGAIPRLGGPAIAIGIFTPFFLIFIFKLEGFQNLSPFHVASVLLGGILALALGFSDDLKTLSSRTKLLGQFLLGALVAWIGLRIDVLWLPWIGNVYLGPWAIPLTAFWIVICMNAANLIDGLDGLCSIMVLISMLAVFFVSLMHGFDLGVWFALAVSGALGGFLMHNFHPATIFMGDGGAYFLGFMLAALTILLMRHSQPNFQILSGFLVVGLPLVDTGLAIARRVIQRRPIFVADGGHIHHRLVKRVVSVRLTVSMLAFLQSAFCSVGVIAYMGVPWQTILAATVATFLVAVLFVQIVWRVRHETISTDTSNIMNDAP